MNVRTAHQQTLTTQPSEQMPHGLIPEDLAHFRWLEEVALSPDGGRVAYTVREPRAALDGYTSRVYVQDVEAGTLISASEIGGLASSLAWSRQGALLAYVWQADNEISVRVWAPLAGEVARVRLDDAPWGLDWNPHGRRIACVRWVRQVEPDAAPAGAPDTVRPTVRVIRRLRYKRDGVGFVHDRFQQVGVLDLNTGEWTQLSGGERDHDEPKWSHSGDRLVMVVTAREQDTELGQGRLYVWEGDSEEIRPLLPGWVGSCRSPQWGPDDRWIAFAGHTHPAPSNRRAFPHAWVLDLRTGETRDLMRSLDQMVGNFAAAQDQRVGYPSPTVQWPAGSDIYFLVTEQGAAHIYHASPDQADLERLVDGACVVFAYSSAGGGRVAFGRADPSNPGDLYLLEGDDVTRLTDLNPWLRSRKLSMPQEYWYKDTRADRVHAWVIPPAGIEPGRRYPTVLYVHCSMFNWDFNHEFQCLAAAGFVVAYFNQWGTTAGYGQAWTLGGQGDLGGREYEDIMVGVDDLVQRPFIDESRLGVTGWSCGGFLTNWIVGHTDRFKAAVSQVAIVSYLNQWAGSDGGPEGTYRETGALPWDDLQTIWRQSPLSQVRRIRTPMLIIHAEDDYRVTIDQAEQLFAALRWLGREVELVRFAGESHLFHQRGLPVNRIERLRHILGWFERHL